jgi:hypothetical protein
MSVEIQFQTGTASSDFTAVVNSRFPNVQRHFLIVRKGVSALGFLCVEVVATWLSFPRLGMQL